MVFTHALDIIMIIELDLFYLIIIIHTMHGTVTRSGTKKGRRIIQPIQHVHVLGWVTTRDINGKPMWAETIPIFILNLSQPYPMI